MLEDALFSQEASAVDLLPAALVQVALERSAARHNVRPLHPHQPPESTPALTPTSNGNTVRSFSTHGQLSAAQGSSATVSHSDIRLIQHLDSSAHGLVRR
jgi:hypothetical protein